MNNVINWQLLKEKSIYEQIKEKLLKQKKIDIIDIKENCDIDEIEKQLDYIDDDYNMYYEKSEFLLKLTELTDDKQQRAIQMITKIDSLDDISEKQKITMILSYGILINYFNRIHERTDEELVMLSACSANIDLEDYTYYVGILSNENVSQAITNKTSQLSEQVNIAYDIMDSQDEFSYDFITPDNYDELVNNGLDIINNYSVRHTK